MLYLVIVIATAAGTWPLGHGRTSTATVESSVPQSLAPGAYHLLACADDLRQVPEWNERNNCQVSPSTVKVIARSGSG